MAGLALDDEGHDPEQHGWVLGVVDEGSSQEIRVAWLPPVAGKLAVASLRVWRPREGVLQPMRGMGLDIRARHLREVIALLTVAAEMAEAADRAEPK